MNCSVEDDFAVELAQIQAESIGWIPLDEGAYLHVGPDENVIQLVGSAVAESFFSSLKKERIRKRIYKTRDLARADVFDYVEVFYNRT